MSRIFSVSVFLLVFATSCMHQKKTASGAMTSAQAFVQETFCQGLIDKNSGNNTKALEDFQKCILLDPNSAAANYEIAGLYADEKHFDQALPYAKSANTLSPTNVWYGIRYAEMLQGNNQQDEAVKIFKQVSDNAPANTQLLFMYADAQRKAGKNEDALTTYKKIESIEGISDTLANEKIAVCEIVGNKSEEENTLKELVKYFPTIKNYNRLGDFYEANNEFGKEDVLYADMQNIFPTDVRVHLRVAELELHSDIPSDRAKFFGITKNAFHLDGQLDEKINFLNKNYSLSNATKLSDEQKSQADTLCAILRKVHPDDAKAFTISGDYYYNEGDFDKVTQNYLKAISLGENQYYPYQRLMEIYYAASDYVSTEKISKQAMDLFPTQSDPYFYLGSMSYFNKDFKKANTWLQLGLDLSPDDVRLNERMGDTQFRLGNVDSAVTFWTKAKAAGSNSPNLDRKISSKKLNDDE